MIRVINAEMVEWFLPVSLDVCHFGLSYSIQWVTWIFKDFNLGYDPKQVHQTKRRCQYADENGHTVYCYITGFSLCNILMLMAKCFPVALFQRADTESFGRHKMCLL